MKILSLLSSMFILGTAPRMDTIGRTRPVPSRPTLQEARKSQWPSRMENVPNEIIVKFKGPVAEAAQWSSERGLAPQGISPYLDEANRRFHPRSMVPVFPGAKARSARSQQLRSAPIGTLTETEQRLRRRALRAPAGARSPALENIFKIKFDLDSTQGLEEVLEAYRRDPNVEYAQRNHKASLHLLPNDPQFNVQWPLHNTGQAHPILGGTYQGTPDADIDAPEAWDRGTGSQTVLVAVIDDGVDYTHPDLRDNMWTNPQEAAGRPGVDDDGNGFVDDIHGYDLSDNDPDPMGSDPHGTHVAGTIAARGNNGIGIAGICWQARIMAVKVFDNSTEDVLAAGIRYAVDNGAEVLNNSWGFNERYPESPLVEDAVAYAVAQGSIPVFSAGNNNDDASYYSPQNSEYTIAVGATDADDAKASFSNYGPAVDLAAPGVDILSTVFAGGTGLQSGTSMACPHVTGAVALLLSHKPELTFLQVRDLLRGTGDPAPTGLTLSGKRLNLNHLVARALSGNLAPAVEAGGPFSIVYPQTSVRLAGSVHDDGKPAGSTPTFRWLQAEGPAPAAFSNSRVLDPTVSFPASGRYGLRLSAADGELEGHDLAWANVSLTRNLGQVGVAGRDLEVGDGFAYVAGGEYIRKVSLSNPAAPSVVATFRSAGARFVHLSLSNGTLFAADSAKRLVAVNAQTMAQAGAVPVADIRDVHALDGYAYLAAGAGGLRIYHVANPAAMTFTIAYNAFWSPMPMERVRSDGYFACLSGPQGSVVIRVADKSRIEDHQDLVHPQLDGYVKAYDIRFSGPYLYLSDSLATYAYLRGQDDYYLGIAALESERVSGQLALSAGNVLHIDLPGKGLVTYDVHEPRRPIRIDSSAFTAPVTDLEAGPGALYVLTGGTTLRILRTQLPNTAPAINLPALVKGSLAGGAQLNAEILDDGQPTGGSLVRAWSRVSGPGTVTFQSPAAAATHVTFSAAGKYVLRLTVSDGDKSAFRETDVWVSGYLQKVDELPFPAGRYAYSWNKTRVFQGYLYQVLAHSVAVYDIANPRKPALIGLFKDNEDFFRDFTVEGNFVYTAGDKGLTILDFTDKAHPVVAGSLDDVSGNPFASCVAVNGRYAYVGYFTDWEDPENNGVFVVDMSDRAAPVARGRVPGVFVTGVKVSGRTLYTLSSEKFQIADVANPDAPKVLSAVPVSYNPYNLEVQGGYAYAGDGDRIQIIRVSDPRNPVVTAAIEADWEIKNLGKFLARPAGNYLFVSQAEDTRGFAVWDITDKAHPVLRDQFADWSISIPDYHRGIVYALHDFGTEILASTLPNTRPDVYAGADLQSAAAAQLSGSATDDGTASLAYAWSKVSGPGTVAFQNAAMARTSATFSAVGRYVLRLTVSDGALSASDDVVVDYLGDTYLQDAGSNGLVVFEAEGFHAKTAQGGHDWTRVAASGSSGGAAMQCTPNSGANVNTGYLTGSPRLDFKVSFAKTGVHYIWARGLGAAGTDDSYHAGLDNAALATCDRIGDFTTTYTWRKLDLDGGQANFTVPSEGVHTVNAWMREDGFVLDKILITTNAGYTPTGEGPAVSPRGQVHILTATAGAGGTVSPSGAVSVQHGADRAFTITPAAGFEIDRVVVDGVGVGAPTTYAFSNVTASHTLEAYFRRILSKLPVISATATSDDGNVPGNVLDGNLATRWSASGDGQKLTLDLGAVKNVSHLRMAFYRGDARNYYFSVDFSQDGLAWFPMRESGSSSGATTGLETIDLPDGPARYVRLTGHGNSENAWNSYTEVEVWGW